MVRAVKESVSCLYPPGSLLSLSVVYGSVESSGSELQLTGLRSSPAAAIDRPPTSDTQSLGETTNQMNQGPVRGLREAAALAYDGKCEFWTAVMPVTSANLQALDSNSKHGGSSRDDPSSLRRLTEFIHTSLRDKEQE